ncbi:hypothetical protein MNEG_16282, partial [Monoraphidium neglectum]
LLGCRDLVASLGPCWVAGLRATGASALSIDVRARTSGGGDGGGSCAGGAGGEQLRTADQGCSANTLGADARTPAAGADAASGGPPPGRHEPQTKHPLPAPAAAAAGGPAAAGGTEAPCAEAQEGGETRVCSDAATGEAGPGGSAGAGHADDAEGDPTGREHERVTHNPTPPAAAAANGAPPPPAVDGAPPPAPRQGPQASPGGKDSLVEAGAMGSEAAAGAGRADAGRNATHFFEP